jgi:hypothetical protein
MGCDNLVSAGKEDIAERLLEIPETDVLVQGYNRATALYDPFING